MGTVGTIYCDACNKYSILTLATEMPARVDDGLNHIYMTLELTEEWLCVPVEGGLETYCNECKEVQDES